MTDLANIRTTLNGLYYGQDVATETPSQGLAKELTDIRTNVSTVETTLGNRKPPKIVAQATDPGTPNTADSIGGLWIDTSGSVVDPTTTLAKYWDSNTNAWVTLSGKVRQDLAYTWTAAHVFKSTLNYFADATARDAAITAPVIGQFAVVGNRVQVRGASSWLSVTPPAAGASGQALVKLSSTDFDLGWANVVTPTGSHTLSGTNSFTGNTSFALKVNMATGLDVVGTTDLDTLNVSLNSALSGSLSVGTTLSVSGAATLSAALTVAGLLTSNGALTVAGISTLNGKTIVPNSATVRDTGFFFAGKRFWVSPTQPTTAVAGDLWIQA